MAGRFAARLFTFAFRLFTFSFCFGLFYVSRGLGMSEQTIERLARDLPDPEGARLFFGSLAAEHPRAARRLAREEGLLADALTLAAHSPFLATTLTQHPEHLAWLARERADTRVRTAEELCESLARFALTRTQVEPHVLLARFRRRELLRTYLHDVRRARTLVETTEELSNLADAALQHALGLARQELDNLYGAPQCTDARGRTARASFTVVALGKLGSRELNYASDIDLMFLYSDDGATSGAGARGSVSNREYFARLAERVARVVGQAGGGEGAAYRVDLRLRPHGRDGAPSSSLAEALRYYGEAAHPWELQALIRARASAGSAPLFARFYDSVRARVYRGGETVEGALAHVRLAKQKIDRHQQGRSDSSARGYNVKLGRGGIREVEFIAQALQLAHGGADDWLRAPHTLISLARLHERGHLDERERAELFDAYSFLRATEHRLQMEHGLQTHAVPEDEARRALVARRMGFAEPAALAAFDRELARHTANVRAAYERVFGAPAVAVSEADAPAPAETAKQSAPLTFHAPERERDNPADGLTAFSSEPTPAGAPRAAQETVAAHAPGVPPPPRRHFTSGRGRAAVVEPHADAETAAASAAAQTLARRITFLEGLSEAERGARLAGLLREWAARTLNARRALSFAARFAASLDKSDVRLELTEDELGALVGVCGASEFFGEMLAGNPPLVTSLLAGADVVSTRDHRALLRAGVDREGDFRGELSALRRAWSRLLVEIGACDVRGELAPGESNRLQTALAAASLNAALLVARRELARRQGRLLAGPRLAVLGLGRLGSGGMDYGSDLDVVFVYDERVPPFLEGHTREQAYARLTETAITALSSLTRDGYLYRVDARLRPDGRNGPLASASRPFVQYLSERAAGWEWLAYVKLRAAAGDLEFGRAVEREARRAIHEAARRAGAEALRAETRRVRERLERERAPRGGPPAVDIKFGPGGMLDVYFAARYLQLRDDVPDEEEDRSTRRSLARLRDAGSLAPAEHRALDEGYALLRSLDHHLRLTLGRSTRLPAPGHPTLEDLARRAGFASADALGEELRARMTAVRAAYDRVTGGQDEEKV